MATRIYDFAALKQEFFESEIKSVSKFFRENYGKTTGKNDHLSQNTKGWGMQKQEYLKKMATESRNAYIKGMKEAYLAAGKNMAKAELKTLNELSIMLLDGNIENLDENAMRNVRPVLEILNHIKLTIGEPTQITRHEFEGDVPDDEKREILETFKKSLKN